MKQKIIIAEDEEALRSLYQEVIVRAFPDAQIEAVTNGADLVDKLRQEEYHLVLSDDNMPRMNGLEAYQLLKSEGRTSKNYFLITSVLGQRREEEIRLSGVNLVRKPITIRTLTRIVEQSLVTIRDFGNTPTSDCTKTENNALKATQIYTLQSGGITNLVSKEEPFLDYQI